MFSGIASRSSIPCTVTIPLFGSTAHSGRLYVINDPHAAKLAAPAKLPSCAKIVTEHVITHTRFPASTHSDSTSTARASFNPRSSRAPKSLARCRVFCDALPSLANPSHAPLEKSTSTRSDPSDDAPPDVGFSNAPVVLAHAIVFPRRTTHTPSTGPSLMLNLSADARVSCGSRPSTRNGPPSSSPWSALTTNSLLFRHTSASASVENGRMAARLALGTGGWRRLSRQASDERRSDDGRFVTRASALRRRVTGDLHSSD